MAPTVVFLTRHADVDANSTLTAKGKERAAALGDLLSSIRISVVIFSKFDRTQQTAAKVIEKQAASPETRTWTEVADVSRELGNWHGKVALVVGHSNTVPQIIKGLTGVIGETINENDFGDLFIVTQAEQSPAVTVKLHYGKLNPAPRHLHFPLRSEQPFCDNLCNFFAFDHGNKFSAVAGVSDSENTVTFKIRLQPYYGRANDPDDVIFKDLVEIKIRNTGITHGPADDRFETVLVKQSYILGVGEEPSTEIPNDEVDADPDHVAQLVGDSFAHIPEGTPAFSSCQMFATVRRVLDVFTALNDEKEIPFVFTRPKLLLLPRVHQWVNDETNQIEPFSNALSSQAGYLAFGFPRGAGGLDLDHPYCENFDVLAHEMGHNITYTLAGIERTADYGGFQETMGDIISLVTLLHFDEIGGLILTRTNGNLAIPSFLTKLGDLPNGGSIRSFLNSKTYSVFVREPHDRSEPLSGALYDVFLKVYFQLLNERKAIDVAISAAAYANRHQPLPSSKIQKAFETAIAGKRDEFQRSLIDARNYLGRTLVKAILPLNDGGSHDFSYKQFTTSLIKVDKDLNHGLFVNIIQEVFTERKLPF